MKRTSVASALPALSALLLVAFIGTGCATSGNRYVYKVAYRHPHEYQLPPGEEQVVKGRPNAFLDSADWWWPNSLLGKLILWNSRVDSHQISDQTEMAVKEFLARNEMTAVKVRLNQWAPFQEFARLAHNGATGWGWRWTFGLLNWVSYTVMPGRIVGGDHFNPFSNTVNIYSDIPAVALHECGHAKDFAGRKWRGTYMFAYNTIPFFKLYPEAKATGTAVGYLRAEGDVAGEKAAYKILYPAYSTYLAGETLPFIPTGPVLSFVYAPASIVTAHVVGRMRAGMVVDAPRAKAEGAPEPALSSPQP
ncbi:MAG: zinc metallopeptidase [Lentisphaerae bacterium]|nr:zinc metallopeptidase [Lentisphaerota bacterium]